MKATAAIPDFKRRLTELTGSEPPFWILTPVQANGKPFCGTFSDNAFELVRDSFWQHIRAITITGVYQSTAGVTEIEYEVGLSRARKIFLVVSYAFILVVGNLVLVVNRDTIPGSLFYIVNGFAAFTFLLGRLITYVSVRIVSERFRTEFEIVDSITDN